MQLIDLQNEICSCVISCFSQTEDRNLKLISMRLILILSHIPSFNRNFQTIELHRSISKCLKKRDSKAEISLSLEYIRLLTELYPESLNEIYFYSLNEFISHHDYEPNLVAVETLLEMVYLKPILACKCGSLVKLVRYVADAAPSPLVIESIMTTIFKVLTEEEIRSACTQKNLFCDLITQFISQENEISSISNDEKTVNFNGSYSKTKTNHEILSACTFALILCLTNYTGITIFCLGDMEYLVSCLKHVKTTNLNYFFRIFYEIFEIDCSHFKHQDKISSFYSIERELLLLHDSIQTKEKEDIRLTDLQKLFVLNNLINAGIFETLVDLYYINYQAKSESIYNKNVLSHCLQLIYDLYVMAAKFSKNTEFRLIYNLKTTEEIFQLIESATKNNSNIIEQSIGYQIENEIVSKLSEPKDKFSIKYVPKLFFKELLWTKINKKNDILITVTDTNNNLSFIEKNNLKHKLKNFNKSLNDHIDQIFNLTNCEKWVEIIKVFELYLNHNPVIEDLPSDEINDHMKEKIKKTIQKNDRVQHLIQYLVKYFTAIVPCDDSLVSYSRNKANIFQDIQTEYIISSGICFIDYLIEEKNSQESLIDVFLLNIKNNLNQSISCVQFETYCELLFILIGHLTSTKEGDDLLSRSGLYDFLSNYIHSCKNVKILQCLLSCLNFNSSKKSQEILVKCIKLDKLTNDRELRALKVFLFYLLKLWVNVLNDDSALEYFEILFCCLNDTYPFLRESSLNLFYECLKSNPQFIDLLIEKKMVPFDMLFRLHKLDKDGISWCIINQFVESPIFLKQMAQERELDLWINEWIDENMDFKFLKTIENRLSYSYTLHNSYKYSKTLFQKIFCDFFVKLRLDDCNSNDMKFYEDNCSEEDEDIDIEKDIELYQKVGIFYGSSCSSVVQTNQIPIHLFSILFKNEFKLSTKVVHNIDYHIKCLKEMKSENIDLLKTSLWVTACISKSYEGFRWVSTKEPNIISLFRKISNEHDNLDVRATAFYCLSQLKNYSISDF